MITDFPLNPLVNFAGLQSFLFSPYQNIAAIPPAVAGSVTSAVTFNAGFNFLKGYSTVHMLGFTEPFTSDDNGGFYTPSITGFVPGDSDEIISLLRDMTYCRHLVATTDFNGVLRLIGINAPLTFSADFDSGKQPGTDAKGYSFTFTGQNRLRAPSYNV